MTTSKIALPKTRARLAAFVLGITAVVGGTMLVAPPAPAQAVGVHNNYYYNYFYSKATCEARGKEMVRTIAVWIGYRCWKYDGHAKWSMDLFYHDGLGCRMSPATDTRTAPREQTAAEIAPMCG